MLLNVKVDHPEYSKVELDGDCLFIHFISGVKRELKNGVKDYVVTVVDDLVHLVVFLVDGNAWHYCGTKELEQERLELGGVYGRGSRLVADSNGHLHLLYLTVQSKGCGAILRHQIYADDWSQPIVVSTNVFPGNGNSFSASWHTDGYLHTAYCSHGDGHLLYRVFDPEHRVWSGAVPFSKKQCHHPQFLHTHIMSLVWIEEERFSVVKMMQKRENWSQAKTLSQPETHGSNVGFYITEQEIEVLWMQGNQIYMVSSRELGLPIPLEWDDYEYGWTVVKTESGGSMAIPVYRPVGRDCKEEPEEQVLPLPTQEDDGRVNEEKKLQEAFIERAFRIQKEWEELREEYGYLRMELGALRREMGQWKAAVQIPDLNPIYVRLDRVERRMLTSLKSQEQQTQDTVQSLNNLQRRVRNLEPKEKDRSTGWWSRVFRKS